MRHDADHAPARAKRFDGFRHGVERVGIEGSETFVEEDGVELGATARGQHRKLIAQRQCERKRCLERFAARQRTHGPGCVRVAVVDDDELLVLVAQ